MPAVQLHCTSSTPTLDLHCTCGTPPLHLWALVRLHCTSGTPVARLQCRAASPLATPIRHALELVPTGTASPPVTSPGRPRHQRHSADPCAANTRPQPARRGPPGAGGRPALHIASQRGARPEASARAHTPYTRYRRLAATGPPCAGAGADRQTAAPVGWPSVGGGDTAAVERLVNNASVNCLSPDTRAALSLSNDGKLRLTHRRRVPTGSALLTGVKRAP